MAQIDCVIDTNPMAREINSVSNHVKGTTAAVVAMRAAVIKAEGDAADHVCDKVNKGFYTLIHSQISQKMAKLQSEVDSHLMKLNMLRRQLLAIKGRMERDYGMISSRYLKLFSGLDKNLKQRVYELDKPVMEFAERDNDTVSNRKKLMLATVPVTQLESLSISQKIIASNMKFRGKRVIDSMRHFLTDMNEQDALTERILLPHTVATDEAQLLMPVVVSETRFDDRGTTQTNVYVTQAGLSKSSCEVVRNLVNAERQNLNWQQSSTDENVRSEFNKLISSSQATQRVKEMMSQLFDASKYEILKDSKP